MKMKQNQKLRRVLIFAISIAAALAVGGLSAVLNAGQMDLTERYVMPPLNPPTWVFPIVWTVLFTLMGISAAMVHQSSSPERSDALFLYGLQLAVNFLWTVFFFRFGALLLSFFWLLFLILLVLLMVVRFSRCDARAGKLQLPYLLWLCFAAYLNFALCLLNKQL